VRRMRSESMWPEPSASPSGPELVHRWEALLDKAPRLRPWVDQMLGRQRLRLQQSGAAVVEIEQILWRQLAHWLADFEALPGFAVSAIAVTLEDDAAHEVEPDLSGIGAEPAATSPEQAVGDLETLLSDAAFALAFHCVDSRLRPRLASSGELGRVPESDWFALLRASSGPRPALTAEVAITLVLHVLSPQWARNPAASRHAALRLFLAGPGDLRGDLRRLCSSLPSHWRLEPGQLAAFVAAAGRARVGLADASALCARIVASARARPGGLALLADASAPPASPEELGALFRNASKYRYIGGFHQLLSAL
jgi:hypothetical protein